jgi:hypothetical protein
MRKFLFVALVIVSVITFSCDTVDTSFDEALPERYNLTTTVIPSGAGVVVPSEGNFVAGSSIGIEAIPNEGYVFSNWGGDLTGTINPRSILFTRDRNIEALFLFRDYPLNIEIVGMGTVDEEVISQAEQSRTDSGTGTMLPVGGDNDVNSGSILTTETSGIKTLKNSDGDSQNSQNTTSETAQFTPVTIRLTAQPASGWVFSRWEGDLTGSANPDTIVVDEEKNVTAVFVQDEPDMYTLAVQLTGQGSVSVNPEKDQYESGEQVVLTATAASGWRFTGWQGDLSGNTNPATLVMNSDKSVTAVFVQDEPDMYTLAVQVTGQGSVSVNPEKDQYESGEEVILTATAASGWRFTGWQGDLSGSTNPATLVMNSDKSVTAVFVQDEPDMYTLAVQVTGQGSVSVNPEKDQYESGEEVELTATAASGWRFTGWQGDLSGNTNPATLVMNSDKSVTAVFVQDEPDMYTLAVQVTGQGSVSVNPEKDQYESGEEVILTATAASGWRFTGWQGDLSGSTNPATLVMNSDKSVTAVFVQDEPDMYTLAVQVTGQGSVGVDPQKDQYESGEQVVLTATAASGWRFTGWQGDLSGSTNPATLVMNSDKSVTAVFVQDEPDMYTLAVQVTGQGSVSVNPEKDQYESGEQVVLTATAASGWRFTGWQGDLSGSTNPATLVMDSDKSVTAVFVQDEPDMYTLAVQVTGQGSVGVDPQKDQYESGEQVVLTATAASGWRFTGWQGDLSGNTNPATLVMDSDKSVTAVFVQDEPDMYTLAVQVTGQGSVGVDPQKDQYESGEQVVLTATAASGWRFTGWQGDLSGSTNPATLVIDSDKSVTAVFVQDEPDTYTLSVQIDGQGSVDIDPEKNAYESGEEVELTATPTPGWRFTGWQGDLSGNSNPATLVMDSDKSVTARFQSVGPPLMEIIQQPSETTAGDAISPAPAVKLSNDLGIPISGADMSVRLNENSFTSGSTNTVKTNKEGHAIFNKLIIETAAADYRITFEADVQDAPDAQSGPFDIMPAAAVAGNSSADVPDGTSGEQTLIRITVQDRFDNPVAGVVDQLQVAVSGANSTTPAVIETAVPGRYTVIYTPVAAGSDQIAIEFAGKPISGSPYTSTVSANAPETVEMISGDDQTGRVNSALDNPFVVKVVDKNGNPVSGVTLAFTITESPTGAIGQRMSNAAATTNAEGLTSSLLTLGSLPGVYQVTVSADGAGAVTFSARAEILAPSLITIVQQPVGTVAGSPISPSPSVRVTDIENNPIEGVAITVSLNGGEFADESTTEILTGADGISGFGNLVINKAASGYTLTFGSLVTGLSDVTTQQFSVVAASGDPSQSSAVVPAGVAGAETRITIRVEDAWGNPAGSAGDLIVEVAGDNEDDLSVTDTGAPGVFEAVYTPEKAGIDLITIRLANVQISGSPYSSQVSAGTVDPSESSVIADPDEVPVGGSSTITVKLRDKFSNPIAGFTDADFEIRLDGNATAGPVSETTEPGTYQFQVSSNTEGDVDVEVTARGITLDDNPEIEFEDEEESFSIGFYSQPENSKVGEPIKGPPAVRITNQNGDPVSGKLVTVRERGGQPFASGTLNVNTGGNGIAVFNDLVIAVRGRYQLEFSSMYVSTINSRTFQVNP